MMPTDLRLLAERVSVETGFAFNGSEGRDNNGCHWFELSPAEYPAGQTFTLRTVVGWRRIDVYFRPGNFAADLVEAMGTADELGRRTFRYVLGACRDAGAEVILNVNGAASDLGDEGIWAAPWRSFGLVISKGMLSINEGDVEADLRQIDLWTSRAAAAIFALLPLEASLDDAEEESQEAIGLPEGAKTRIEVNRYERDRRNRAAALAIHGYTCKACELDMGARYGAVAAGLIEVHHTTPVSELGSGYIVNPKTDLTPLCPNCHSVAHRRSPPFSIVELRRMLQLI